METSIRVFLANVSRFSGKRRPGETEVSQTFNRNPTETSIRDASSEGGARRV